MDVDITSQWLQPSNILDNVCQLEEELFSAEMQSALGNNYENKFSKYFQKILPTTNLCLLDPNDTLL